MRQQQARLVFDAALAEVSRHEARLAEAADGGVEAYRRAAALGAWQARSEQVAALGQAVEAARREARKAEQKWQEAGLARSRIASEVEALLVLRRQQWEAHQAEAARREQEQLDELG